MTNVIHLASQRAAKPVHTSAQTPDTIARQAAIENALSMALYYVRNAGTQQAIHAATAKAVRATALLKQACTDTATFGGA